MPQHIIAILLVVNSLLILFMLLVLVAVLKQGRRIARIARETQHLAQEAERHPAEIPGEEVQPPQGS